MDTLNTEFNALFDAESWFRTNSQNTLLTPETIKIVAGFTLLWNLFEDCVCDTHAKINAFKNIIPNLQHLSKIEKLIDESLAYYQNRYIEGQDTNYLFQKLYFQKWEKKWKDHVKAVLKGEVTEIEDKILALLIIAFRIRNNLFHGNKPVYNLNEQAENISEASRILSIIIEAKVSTSLYESDI